MFKGTKRIAALLAIIAGFAAFALSGCMPTTGTGEAGSDPSGGLMGFLPLILIIAVFYFILIRPQNKKNKQVAQMRDSLKRGDWVTTIGGFRGRVVKVKDDLLTIEVGSDKVKLDVMRWGISKIDESAPEKKTTSKKEAEPVKEPEEEEEEQPKRKPKKLTPVAKSEPEPEPEDADEPDDGDGDDGDEGDEKE